MAKGKWKARLAELQKTYEKDQKQFKEFKDALDKMSGPAQDFARVCTKEGATMKKGMNQMKIQLTACIEATAKLYGFEGDLEAAQKAKDKKKVAEIEKKMVPFVKTHDVTKKQGRAAMDQTQDAIRSISASMSKLQSAMA